MEPGVVHFVVVFLLEEDRLVAVTPEDLVGQVRAPALRGHGRGLHHTLEDDHDLKVCIVDVLLAQIVQRTVLIDLMDDGDGRHQKYAVNAAVEAHVDVYLIQGDVLPLGGDSGLEELRTHVCLHQVALAEVAHPPHEAELAVPHGNHGVVAEDQRLVSLLGLGHLGHYRTDDEGVDDAAHDGLKDHHEDGHGALVCDAAEAVADGGLRLDGEKEGSREAVDLGHTGFALLGRIQVPVEQRDQPKHTAEEEPGEHESQAEDDQHPPPADVHARGEDVGQVPLALLAHVDELHVAVSVLLHEAAPALLAGVDFALAIPKPVGHRQGGQLHAVLLRWDDAVAVGAHAAHRFCCGRQRFCFGKQSQFLQNPLEKQVWMFSEDPHAQKKKEGWGLQGPWGSGYPGLSLDMQSHLSNSADIQRTGPAKKRERSFITKEVH